MITPNASEQKPNAPASGVPNSQGNGAPVAQPGQAGQPTPPAQSGASGQEQPAQQVPITALHEERDKRQALQSELDNLKQMLQQPDPYGQQPTQQPGQFQQPQYPNQPQPPPTMERLDQLWEDNPRQGFQQEMMTAMQWWDHVDNVVEDQLDQVRTKHNDFSGYEGNVRRYIRRLPIDQRARTGIAEAAYFIVKGQNAETLAQKSVNEATQKANAGQAAAGMGPGATGTQPPENKPTLTEDELKVAAAMNMTPEDYVKHKDVKRNV